MMLTGIAIARPVAVVMSAALMPPAPVATAAAPQSGISPARVDASYQITLNGFDLGTFRFQSNVGRTEYTLASVTCSCGNTFTNFGSMATHFSSTHSARGLDVAFAAHLITVPDLNLHLGAAHRAELLRRFDGRVDAALAAYNAGSRPALRWLERPDAADPDQFIELITYPQTRGYVRSVLRNRDLYRALYGSNDGR